MDDHFIVADGEGDGDPALKPNHARRAGDFVILRAAMRKDGKTVAVIHDARDVGVGAVAVGFFGDVGADALEVLPGRRCESDLH